MNSGLAGHAKPAPDNLADYREQQAEEAEKKLEKMRKRARVEYISATQIQQFIDCPRRWFFRYIMGIKTPPTPAMEYGTRIHKELETYVNSAPDRRDSPKWAPETKHLLAGNAVEMPSREGRWGEDENGDSVWIHDDQFITEFNCVSAKIIIGGAKLRGYIDLAWPRRAALLLIRDWKTRSRFNYAPSSEELQHDIQALLYSHTAFVLGWAEDELEFEHVNILRADKGGPAIKCVSAIMTREHVQKKIDAKISPLVERMRLTAKRELVRVRMHKTSCFKYGPCEHKARCYAVPYVPDNHSANGKGGDSTMTHTLDDLMGPPPNTTPAPTNGAAPAETPPADDPVAAAEAMLAKAKAAKLQAEVEAASKAKAKEEAEKAEEVRRLFEARQAEENAAAIKRNAEDGVLQKREIELDPVAKAEAMLAKAKADQEAALALEANVDGDGLVKEGDTQTIASGDVGDLLDALMPGGSSAAPNVQGPDVEGDRKPVDSHSMTIAEFPWKSVDNVGEVAAQKILAWAEEKGLIYVSELESVDLTEVDGVGPKASTNIRAKIAEKRPFKPKGEEQLAEAPAEGASQEDILLSAKKAVLSGKIPNLTGASHETKLALSAWQKEQREEAKAPEKGAPEEKTEFRPDMAAEYDREGEKPTVFCINCYPDKGMDYVRFEDLLGPHFLAVAESLEAPFWCMPEDFGNGSKALGFRVYGHAADFKGRVIVFFGDAERGPLASAVREMALHADVVLRGR